MNPFERKLAELEQKIDRIARGNAVNGTVVGNNTVNGTVTMQIIDPDGTVTEKAFPVASNFVPEAGSTAVIHMNGTNPLVIPLNGQTVAADGSWLRSPDYLPGISGWKIDADGSAEFNDLTARGRADLSPGSEVLAQNTQDLETNISGWVAQTTATAYQFDSTVMGFTGQNATVTFDGTTVYNPPGAVQVVASAATYEARSPMGSSGVATAAGNRHRVVMPVLAGTNTDSITMTPCIRWWDASDVQIGADVNGAALLTDNAVWRFGVIDAVAPAGSTHLSIVYKFSGGASGDVHFIDEVAITSPPNSTVSRDTVTKRSGTASLKVTSLAAGLALAGTPDTGDGTGYDVTEDEYYYFRMYYRQPLGLGVIVVPAWLDDSGVLVSATITQDSFADTSSANFRLYNAVWKVPAGATRLSIAIGFFSTGATQTMNIDDISLVKMTTIRGGVWRSPAEIGSTSQSSEEMSVFLRSSDSGFPYMQANGHVFHRAVHGRIQSYLGAPQTVPSGVWTTVIMNVDAELYGMQHPPGDGNALVIPRNGIYEFSGVVSWDAFLFVSTFGVQVVAVERWSAAGFLLERYDPQSVYQNTSAAQTSLNCATQGRANKGEKIYLRVYQDHGSNLTIQSSISAYGGQHQLAVTYLGDVN